MIISLIRIPIITMPMEWRRRMVSNAHTRSFLLLLKRCCCCCCSSCSRWNAVAAAIRRFSLHGNLPSLKSCFCLVLCNSKWQKKESLTDCCTYFSSLPNVPISLKGDLPRIFFSDLWNNCVFHAVCCTCFPLFE